MEQEPAGSSWRLSLGLFMLLLCVAQAQEHHGPEHEENKKSLASPHSHTLVIDILHDHDHIAAQHSVQAFGERELARCARDPDAWFALGLHPITDRYAGCRDCVQVQEWGVTQSFADTSTTTAVEAQIPQSGLFYPMSAAELATLQSFCDAVLQLACCQRQVHKPADGAAPAQETSTTTTYAMLEVKEEAEAPDLQQQEEKQQNEQQQQVPRENEKEENEEEEQEEDLAEQVMLVGDGVVEKEETSGLGDQSTRGKQEHSRLKRFASSISPFGLIKRRKAKQERDMRAELRKAHEEAAAEFRRRHEGTPEWLGGEERRLGEGLGLSVEEAGEQQAFYWSLEKKLALYEEEQRLRGSHPVSPVNAGYPFHGHSKCDIVDTEVLDGLAEIHTHMFSSLSFGGTMVLGPHNGTLADLKPCDGMPTHGLGASGEYPHFLRTDGYPTFRGWPRWDSNAHQQVHVEWLKAAATHPNKRTRLVLFHVAPVNNELLCLVGRALGKIRPEFRDQWAAAGYKASEICHNKPNMDRQLRAAREMAEQNSDWMVLAEDAASCREAIKQNKLCLSLSGGESGNPCGDEETPEECVDRMFAAGGRSLQVVHLRNNRFSGSGFHTRIVQKAYGILAGLAKVVDEDSLWKKLMGLSMAARAGFDLAFKKFPVDEHREIQGTKLVVRDKNPLGLTEEGERLVKYAMEKGMMIDLSHTSEHSQQRIYELAQEANWHPLFRAHDTLIQFEKAMEEEYNSDFEMLLMILKTGGIWGFRPYPSDMRTYTKSTVPNVCRGSSMSHVQLLQFIARELGLPVALGFDGNGGAKNALPRFYNVSEDPLRLWANEACVDHECNLQDPTFWDILFEKNTGARKAMDKKRASSKCRQAFARGQAQRRALLRHPTFKVKTGSVFDHKGMGSVDTLPHYLDDLIQLGYEADCPVCLGRSAENFIRMWERVSDPSRKELRPAVETTKGLLRQFWTKPSDSVILPHFKEAHQISDSELLAAQDDTTCALGHRENTPNLRLPGQPPAKEALADKVDEVIESKWTPEMDLSKLPTWVTGSNPRHCGESKPCGDDYPVCCGGVVKGPDGQESTTRTCIRRNHRCDTYGLTGVSSGDRRRDCVRYRDGIYVENEAEDACKTLHTSILLELQGGEREQMQQRQDQQVELGTCDAKRQDACVATSKCQGNCVCTTKGRNKCRCLELIADSLCGKISELH